MKFMSSKKVSRELSLAIFYNFKDEQTCPFCKMVKNLYDKGGTKLVLDRLGLLDGGQHVHDFQKCFIHHYWVTDTYNDEVKLRPMRIVIDEGFEIFKKMKQLLSIK